MACVCSYHLVTLSHQIRSLCFLRPGAFPFGCQKVRLVNICVGGRPCFIWLPLAQKSEFEGNQWRVNLLFCVGYTGSRQNCSRSPDLGAARGICRALRTRLLPGSGLSRLTHWNVAGLPFPFLPEPVCHFLYASSSFQRAILSITDRFSESLITVRRKRL